MGKKYVKNAAITHLNW